MKLVKNAAGQTALVLPAVAVWGEREFTEMISGFSRRGNARVRDGDDWGEWNATKVTRAIIGLDPHA